MGLFSTDDTSDIGDIVKSNNINKQAVFDITQQQLLECILVELKEINQNIKFILEA